MACDRCNLFPAIFQDIESVLETIEIPLEQREELKYIITQSRGNIEAWKAHLFRSVNQDEARLDVLNSLIGQEVLVVLDWAMKFLPRKYREIQADWYGKRGISWDISVATRKCKGQIEMLTRVSKLFPRQHRCFGCNRRCRKTTERKNAGHQINHLQARQRWLLPQRCNHAGSTTTRLLTQCCNCPKNGFFRSSWWERSL